MLKISCLHSAHSDIDAFEAARRALRLDDVILKHRVRSDLVAEVESSHPTVAGLARRIAAEFVSVARGADVLLLTCPTLGRLSTAAAQRMALPVVRADVALATESVAAGGSLVVLCSAGASLSRIRELFEGAAMATSTTVELRLAPRRTETESAADADYLRLVAEAADAAADEGGVRVALAQTAIAGAAPLARCRPFSVPAAALRAAVAAGRRHVPRP